MFGIWHGLKVPMFDPEICTAVDAIPLFHGSFTMANQDAKQIQKILIGKVYLTSFLHVV
jgi:hypothetical protein